MKTAYHPSMLIAFYLHCLPADLLEKIPRSTKYDWHHKNISDCFGYDWYCCNEHLFQALEEVANNKKLLQVNLALLRIIAIRNFFRKYTGQISHKLFNSAATVVMNIEKVKQTLGGSFTLKLLHLSYQQYWQLSQKVRCRKSFQSLCIPMHPAQLMRSEVGIIRKYGEDPRYIHWPLVSIYHQILRDGAACFHLSTFYKYAGLLQVKRTLPVHRRKNHATGIRASAPLRLLHADVTVFTTADNIKSYIYLIQDNFSRTILKFAVTLQCKAATLFELLKIVHSDYLQPASLEHCQLMTDDGSENFGVVQHFLKGAKNPKMEHIIAQRDVTFSNSMIEAANKNIKYRFLYHQPIANYGDLCKYVPMAVDDFNNRPHDILSGLTPLEVLNGKTVNKATIHQKMILAKAMRIKENKKVSCCNYPS